MTLKQAIPLFLFITILLEKENQNLLFYLSYIGLHITEKNLCKDPRKEVMLMLAKKSVT
ncbi:unnamed protein product [Natator depressus]